MNGRVWMGQLFVGRVLDAKPHPARWIAKDRAGHETRHVTKREAAEYLAAKWSGQFMTVRFTGVYDHTNERRMFDMVGEGDTVDAAWGDVVQQYMNRELTYNDWEAA